MSQKSSAPAARGTAAAKPQAEQVVRDIHRRTRKQHSAGEKMQHRRAVPPRGHRRELYYAWSEEFLEAGQRRLAGDTACSASTDRIKALRQEARPLKEAVAEQALELRCWKKHDRGWGRSRTRYPAAEKLEIIRLCTTR